MVKETVLEINLAHLTHNFEYIKSKIDTPVKMMAVVKAFGYGSNAVVIAKHLQRIGIDYFAVAYTAEGIELRDAGIQKPILVLHPQPVNFHKLIQYQLQPSLYSSRILADFEQTLEKANQKNYPVHLKFNSGLNRIGFGEDEVDSLITKLSKTSRLRITSLFSHLAASEDLKERSFTLQQIEFFKNIAAKVTKGLGYTPILHQSNTSGIFNYPEAHFDMVRTGIGLYGYGNDPKFDHKLKPIAALKSIISQIHTLKPGDTVGYNRAFKAKKKIRTATIPIGHADGISRQYGQGKGFVKINERKAAIIGNVCMDMIMVDVTAIDCAEGDEVILFDHNDSAAHVAENAGTISYELLTAISPRVKRVFVDKN